MTCSGACGAFVHALEDQFLEVRMAAVDSMGELAGQTPVWSSKHYCQTICIETHYTLNGIQYVLLGVWG